MPARLASEPCLSTVPTASRGLKEQLLNEWTNDCTNDSGRTVRITNATNNEPRGAVPELPGRAGSPRKSCSKRVRDTYCVPGPRARG